MEKSLIPFKFEGMDQRTLKIDGRELWCIQDSCRILGIKNFSDAAERIPQSHIVKADVDIMLKTGRTAKRKMLFVDEAGLNYLIMRSNKPIAMPYKEWNLAIVLPTLRSTGTYTIPGREPEVMERRYTDDKLSQMNTHIERMLASLKELVPIVDENMAKLNAHTAEFDANTSRLNALINAGTKRTDAFEGMNEAIAAELTPTALKSVKDRVGEIVRKYAANHKYNPHTVMESLFWKFKKNTGIDLRQLAKDAGNLDPFDIAENLGKSWDLLILSIRLFVGK